MTREALFDGWTDNIEKRVENDKKLRAKLWNNLLASVHQSDHKGTKKHPLYNEVKEWYKIYNMLNEAKNAIIDKLVEAHKQ